MKKLIYLFGLFITILASCDPDEPCPTCFEDVVRCKVNGEKWVSNCKSSNPLFGCESIDCYYYFKDNNTLNLSSGSYLNNSGISLNNLSGKLIKGKNEISKRDLGFRDFSLHGNCSYLDSLDVSYPNIFEIIYLDTINYVLEGKFQFKVFNLCGDTATITEGYFKTKFLF